MKKFSLGLVFSVLFFAWIGSLCIAFNAGSSQAIEDYNKILFENSEPRVDEFLLFSGTGELKCICPKCGKKFLTKIKDGEFVAVEDKK